ncbi:MAG TPA: endonuclease/exonuclease/phosphatase family protein [Longimicrobiaceae bacterium]|nr:endonuclease/exonuclease/phosphatase family protein [Longimicrobiaceae bacterium]
MRLVTWNCCKGRYEKKAPRAMALAPDVMVVQECARPREDAEGCGWTGENPNQGMAVVTSGGFSAVALPPLEDVPAYHLPYQVRGPVDFLLLSVWAQKNKVYPYVRGVYRAMERYADAIRAQPTVVMGDFNSNTIWDHQHRRSRSHSDLVALLGEMGLVSAYHVHHAEVQGAESRPTYYHTWNRATGFHIDYCFIPREWTPHVVDVQVGGYEDWADASDHRPLIVDVRLPAPAA